jgi:hypothetical protein
VSEQSKHGKRVRWCIRLSPRERTLLEKMALARTAKEGKAVSMGAVLRSFIKEVK